LSREYFERLADSRIVIANAALPKHFRRRDGQVVLQTWHGTPLKRLRLDMITFEHVRAGYAADSIVEAEQWTHLISPSPYCSGIFPRAFAFSNELLEIGAPGNDRLIDPDDDEVIAIRERVGLAAHQRVVLFAPTWRDNQRTATGATAELGWDPERLLASLDDDTLVLFRAHNMVSSVRGMGADDRFVNVTDYPDIADLYLIADALCTDYSSAMFDYACLGRPMAFYCTDLDHYRDELRGFYFDFTDQAPGPIITEERHLGPQLSRLLNDGLSDDERVRFDAFAKLFVPLDDGGASRRAADAILDAIG